MHYLFIYFIFFVRNGSNQDSKETLLNVQDISGINNVEVESSKPSETQEKKIWTRGEFTHQNSGIGGSDDNEEYRYKYELSKIILYF
jgi:hypothetical protein